jgi:hypothetical protein
VGVAELFLLGSNPMITVLSGLEVAVEISALGIGGEEGGVLLGGHIEVLIDLSTLSKFQFQHLLFRSIADTGDAAGVYGNSLHAFLDTDELRKDRGGSFCFQAPGHRLLDPVDGIVRECGPAIVADRLRDRGREFSRADQAVHRRCAFSASI